MSEQNLNPKIGLVTVLYNGKEVLPDFFKSLAKQGYKNYVLYVIDNSPNDEALDLAKELAGKYFIPTEFVNNNANLGVAKGNNQGVELSLAAGCEFVLFLNNDIDFEGNVIEDMVHYAVEHNENIVVPKIYYAGTNKLWYAGGGFNLWKGLNYHRGDKSEDLGKYDKIEHVGYAPTCFMLVRDVVFKKIGLMDEDYFVYFDDTDFVWRANKNGFKVLYNPKLTINHQVSISTGGAESSFSTFYSNRNRLIFIHKNLSFGYKLSAYTYFLATRVVKLVTKSSQIRSSITKGIVEGLRYIKY